MLSLKHFRGKAKGLPDLLKYAALTDEIEMKLDEADKAAAADSVRYTEDEVFSRVRNRIHERKAL